MSRWLTIAIALAACEGGKGGGFPPPEDAGGSGIQCGGFAGTPCPADEYCDFPTNNCGGTDETGICRAKPVSCDTLFAPVCGCDGQVHGNECSAKLEGVDLNAFGCEVEQGQFACGHLVCDVATQFCLIQRSSDIGSMPDDVSCEPVPASCGGSPTCACVDTEICRGTCSGTNIDGITIDCG